MSLRSLDGEHGGMKLIPNIELKNKNSVVFQLSLLFRRLWIYTMLARGCEEHPVMKATNLSKAI